MSTDRGRAQACRATTRGQGKFCRASQASQSARPPTKANDNDETQHSQSVGEQPCLTEGRRPRLDSMASRQAINDVLEAVGSASKVHFSDCPVHAPSQHVAQLAFQKLVDAEPA
jgi:hypothetical protein